MRSNGVFLISVFFLTSACGLEEGGLCLFATDAGCAQFTSDSGDAEAGSDADSTDSGQDSDIMGDADGDATDSGSADSPIDAVADTGPDTGSDSGPDAGICGSSGTVVFDPSMSCYKEGIYRSGNFLSPPDSSPDTPTCQTGTCGNSPKAGDFEALWVRETLNTGKFTSSGAPSSFSARCTAYTAASPPSMTQLKAEMVAPTGWFSPNVTVVATTYTLTAPSCAGGSVLYVMKY